MNEAARCDRISLMDSGRVLATDTPAELIKAAASPRSRTPSSAISKRRPDRALPETEARRALGRNRQCRRDSRRRRQRLFSLQRLFAYTIRETLELLRDPIRLDVRLVRYGVADAGVRFRHFDRRQQSDLRGARSRSEPREPRLSRGTARLELISSRNRRSPIMPISKSACRAATSMPPLKSRPASAATSSAGVPAWVGAWVDGAMPFRAETIRGYLQGMHQLYLTDPAVKTTFARRTAACRYRIQVQVQPGFRQHLRDGASSMSHVAGAVPRDPDGACHRARKGTRLDHQSLRDPGNSHRISARQADSLYRRRHGRISR